MDELRALVEPLGTAMVQLLNTLFSAQTAELRLQRMRLEKLERQNAAIMTILSANENELDNRTVDEVKELSPDEVEVVDLSSNENEAVEVSPDENKLVE